jgi:hypothetical protein
MFDVEYPDNPNVLLLRKRVLVKVDSKQLNGFDSVIKKGEQGLNN